MSGGREHLLRVLIGDVMERRLKPGDPLPAETELASRFRVSQELAHGCVRHLERRGIVAVRPGAGAVVGPEARWDLLDPDVLDAVLAAEDGPAILEEYLEARRTLEVVAGGLAAERATRADLTALSDFLARMTAASQRASATPSAADRYHEADMGFHRALVAAAGNRPLGQALAPVQRALCTARRPLAGTGAEPEHDLPEHQRILEAVSAGDVDAARQAMREHLVTVESSLRQYADRRLRDFDAAESRDAG